LWKIAAEQQAGFRRGRATTGILLPDTLLRNILCTLYRCLRDSVPGYLAELSFLCQTDYRLRSTDVIYLLPNSEIELTPFLVLEFGATDYLKDAELSIIVFGRRRR